jgi:hypothetical protein
MRGISLIETIVYIALLSVFLASTITLSYGIITANNTTHDEISSQEERTFVREKIDWAFSVATAVSITSSGKSLTLRTQDSTIDPIVVTFDSSYHSLSLSEGTKRAVAITSPNTNVESFLTTAASLDASGIVGTKISFTMDGESVSLMRFLP